MGERLGMFDDAGGRIRSDAATWQLIAQRDAGEFATAAIDVAGRKTSDYPLEPGDRIDALPHLPDPLARGAAIRDLPGTPSGPRWAGARAPARRPVGYDPLSDPNPRPGSATLVSFRTNGDWQKTAGVRLALRELPAARPTCGRTGIRPAACSRCFCPRARPRPCRSPATRRPTT